MADMFTDLLIYIGIGILMAAIGLIIGYQLLMMHYSVRDKALVALGEQETMAIIGDIVERLRKRFGDQLGTPSA